MARSITTGSAIGGSSFLWLQASRVARCFRRRQQPSHFQGLHRDPARPLTMVSWWEYNYYLWPYIRTYLCSGQPSGQSGQGRSVIDRKAAKPGQGRSVIDRKAAKPGQGRSTLTGRLTGTGRNPVNGRCNIKITSQPGRCGQLGLQYARGPGPGLVQVQNFTYLPMYVSR